MYDIGVAKTEITAFEDGIGMLGWGYGKNVVKGVAMPLFSRAFVVGDPQNNTKLVYSISDICFVTQAIRLEVLTRLQQRYPELGYGEHNVMLSATHTHSASGGISQYVFYNATVPGYSQPVFETTVEGILRAIVEADGQRRPGRIWMNSGDIGVSQPVSFNRSIDSYNANRDVFPKIEGKLSPHAVDRQMVLLRFDDAQGKPLGVLNWFGVHGTSIHRDNQLLHPDNKGCAADAMERRVASELGEPSFVAGFAQKPCADVTPNSKFDKQRGLTLGQYRDDFKSARFNGKIQAEKAWQLFGSAHSAVQLSGELDCHVLYQDFSKIEVDPAFAGGLSSRRTGPAVIGFRMLFGTREGPGLPYALTGALEKLAHFLWWKRELKTALGHGGPRQPEDDIQGNKLPFLETGRGRAGTFFGVLPVAKGLPLPPQLDTTLTYLHKVIRTPEQQPRPWTPNVLPAQLFVLGPFAIAAVAGEISTVSGRRLAAGLLRTLGDRSIKDVVVAPYSNAYAGYITTPEEYRLQTYEGASTHFGRWTLGGHQTVFERLARRMLQQPEQRPTDMGPPVPRFSAEELATRSYRVSQ